MRQVELSDVEGDSKKELSGSRSSSSSVGSIGIVKDVNERLTIQSSVLLHEMNRVMSECVVLFETEQASKEQTEMSKTGGEQEE